MLISLIMVSWFFKNLYCIVRNIFLKWRLLIWLGLTPRRLSSPVGPPSPTISASRAWPGTHCLFRKTRNVTLSQLKKCTSDNYAKLFEALSTIKQANIRLKWHCSFWSKDFLKNLNNINYDLWLLGFTRVRRSTL